jgi:MerR family copper efflux transcriptional regulator
MPLNRHDAAEAVGIGIETLRYYERLFPSLVPSRDANNYRQYSERHMSQLAFIAKAKEYGFSLAEIRRFLALIAAAGVDKKTVIEEIDRKLAEIDGQIAALTKRKELLESLKTASGLGECDVLSAIRQALT